MDPSPMHNNPSIDEEDEWDTEGFVIPSLELGEQDQGRFERTIEEASKPVSPKAKKEVNIYLGPHGAPPSQTKQPELISSSRKQKFKQKLKEADKRTSGAGRENKLENIQELVGGGGASANMSKGSNKDWLDPHCHESLFEK